MPFRTWRRHYLTRSGCGDIHSGPPRLTLNPTDDSQILRPCISVSATLRSCVSKNALAYLRGDINQHPAIRFIH